ncbi:hypothetical protein KCG48_06920 [Proteiniclasticum sp. BAD-10]|uniref:Uncharacterized protein n=1 Tax=Proteiniclasticum sediminis TaxID=2804028 RepID=A0A941HRC0_9CLOT|nr:hypothetical protein [Proteiniclasticum sediminis]MBR0576072.1 hypothetical protein [Proteiniclasticum sediminis]
MFKFLAGFLIVAMTGTGAALLNPENRHEELLLAKLERAAIKLENKDTETELDEEVPETEAEPVETPAEEEVFEPKAAWTKEEVALLDGVDGEEVLTLEAGTEVLILEHLEKSFVKVSYEGQEYFVSVRHLASEARAKAMEKKETRQETKEANKTEKANTPNPAGKGKKGN